jgi:hypothetical protein
MADRPESARINPQQRIKKKKKEKGKGHILVKR